jgi:hypothetical protein
MADVFRPVEKTRSKDSYSTPYIGLVSILVVTAAFGHRSKIVFLFCPNGKPVASQEDNSTGTLG